MKIHLLVNGQEIALSVINHFQVPFYPEAEECWPFDCEEPSPIFVSEVYYFEHNRYGIFGLQDNIPMDDHLRPMLDVKLLN